MAALKQHLLRVSLANLRRQGPLQVGVDSIALQQLCLARLNCLLQLDPYAGPITGCSSSSDDLQLQY